MANKIVRWGLLSTARINERVMPEMRTSQRCDVVAVASRSEAKAQQYARQWEIPRHHGSYEQLLEDAEVDAVYISLPNGLHATWAVRCANAGKHVLCEKPLALSTGEVDQMANAARRNGVIIQEAAMMRFHPQTRRIRELLASKQIGDLRLIRGVFTYVLNNPDDVRMDPDQGGGALWDLGSYCVSFCRNVMDAEPAEVLATDHLSDTGVDLSFWALMRFDGGTVAQFFASLDAFGHVEADLLGTTGRIQLSSPWVNQLGFDAVIKVIHHDGSPPKSTWDDGMKSQTVKTESWENANAYEHEVNAMAASILDGAPIAITLDDSRRNVATIRALIESARTGRAVRPGDQ